MKWTEPGGKDSDRAYAAARKAYGTIGVDAEQAIERALAMPVSLHCWQADDVQGLERHEEALEGGGILATGGYPGRPRNGDEIRADLARALALLPGVHRVNIHALYAEPEDGPVDRDALRPEHFKRWLAWAKAQGIGLDFNTSFFAHPKANDGYTLAHPDPAIRRFWVRHGVACRRIAEHMGRTLKSPCTLNHWLPDGAKDSPADRWGPRARLVKGLDAILAEKHKVSRRWCRDTVEGKLFGIGSEDYVVGSNEFYAAYALSRGIRLCLDMGHFHPTETIHDKISALLCFHRELLLHVSRPVRWDSDHIVLFNDDVRAVFQEVVRGGALDRVAVALDFFDASINRIAAYVIGARATRKALLSALLEPADALQRLEREGKGAQKLGLMEELKTMPFGAVWDRLCRVAGRPAGAAWLADIEAWEREAIPARSGR